MSLADQITLSSDVAGVGSIKPLELPATRYQQGGRTQYHINVPVIQVIRLVQKPDPARLIEGNRKVETSRAKKFATYLRKEREWVCPAIIARVDARQLTFVPMQGFENGTSWGVLQIPLEQLQRLLLLDGQHRSLGFSYAEEATNMEISKLNALLSKQREQGQPEEMIAMTQYSLGIEREIQRRLGQEHVSIDIVEVQTERAAQMFADINNNAKGVNPDYTTQLDQRDVVNRIAVDVATTHRLLVDNVEIGQSTRMSAANPHLIGLKSVADLVRAVLVGNGRVGARVEDELNRDIVLAKRKVEGFLDTLVAGFSTLGDIADGRISPEDLREKSMLGSSTMLRALAAAYHDLTVVDPVKARAEVEQYFRQLQPLMSVFPTVDDKVWMPTGAFIPDTRAPQARQGSIKSLTDALVTWGRTGNLPTP